jgi:hypothetical protein
MFPLRVHGSESLDFPASSITLTVAGRAFEAFPYMTESTEVDPVDRGDSPILSDGLPLANPAHSDVAIAV